MSLPNIVAELQEVIEYFFPLMEQAYPGQDRGKLFEHAELFAEEWLIGQLGKAMEEFRRKKNSQ